MAFSMTAKPLTYYVNITTDDILDQLQKRYGTHLEYMDGLSKRIFRAALAIYQVIHPTWDEEVNSISCVDCCIAGAGGDDFNIWEEEAEIVSWIQDCGENLSEDEIEGLINAMSAQLQGES